MKHKYFAPYTWGVLVWNLVVILLGAYVRATGSGAGCGRNWPLCDGQIIPRAPEAEMVIEFTHRLVSGIDIILIAVMIVWGFRISTRGQPLRTGLIASGVFIVIEALLGAGLVLFELVAENSSGTRAFAVALHLANTFILLGSLTLTAYWASGGQNVQIRDQAKRLWLLGIGLVGMLAIGMSGAVTALGDTLFPASSLAEGIAQELDPNAHFLVRLRVFHPIVAVLVALYSLNAVRLLYATGNRLARQLLIGLVVAGVLQLSLGLVNLLLLAPLAMQLVHLLSADFVWILYVLTAAAILKKPHSTS